MARNLAGERFFSFFQPDVLLLSVSTVLAWWLSQRFVQMRQVKEIVREDSGPRFWGVTLWIVGLYFSIDLFFTYQEIFVSFVRNQDNTGLYGTRSSDLATHLSISRYLESHPLMDSNPFYYKGTFNYYTFFDLMVTSIRRILGCSLNRVFFLVMPAIVIFSWLSLWVCWSHGRPAIFRLFSLIAMWIVCREYFAYSYNALGLAYCVFLIIVFLNALNSLDIDIENKKIPWLNYFLWASIVAVVSIFASQIKFLMWAPILGGCSFAFAWHMWNQRATMRLKDAGFLFTFVLLPLALPVAWVWFSFLKHGPVYYQFKLPPVINLTHLWGLGFLLVFVLLVCLHSCISLRAKGYVVTLFGASVFATLLVAVVQPILNEGGALSAYPIIVLRAAIFLVPTFLVLIEWNRGAATYTIILKQLGLYVALLIVFPFILWGGEDWRWMIPGNDPTAPTNATYPTSPNSDIISLIDRLNVEASSNDTVITNYSELDRYYSFSSFSRVVPFLSAGLYSSIQYQTDFAARQKIYQTLFENGDVEAFANKLANSYPEVRFLFIDNSIAFQENPPAELYLAYGGSRNSSISSIIPKYNFEARGSWRRLGAGKGYEREFPGQFILTVHDFAPTLDKGVRLGIFVPIMKNDAGCLYRIQMPKSLPRPS